MLEAGRGTLPYASLRCAKDSALRGHGAFDVTTFGAKWLDIDLLRDNEFLLSADTLVITARPMRSSKQCGRVHSPSNVLVS